MKEQIIAILMKHFECNIGCIELQRSSTEIAALFEAAIAERMPTEECFLSPIKEEREWQEYCLHQLYTQYPNICQWQLMNGLIYMTAKANNTYLPTMDEFRSRMEEKK